MKSRYKNQYPIIKELFLILSVSIVLVGCDSEIKDRAEVHASSNPTSLYDNNGTIYNPEPTTLKYDLRSIAYDGSHLYVAVGSNGTIVTSSDGAEWISSKSGTDSNLWSVIWGNNQFVSVGDNGTILTSTDGANWDTVNSDINSDFIKIRWDGKYYNAIGNGIIYASSDGKAWLQKDSTVLETDKATGDKLPYRISDILWDGKQYIAVGDGNFILSSDVLGKWIVRIPNSQGTGMFCNIEWNGKRYVAVGDHLAISTSADGRKWSDNGIRINNIESVEDYYTLCLNSVTWGHDKFMAVGHKGLILESKDGLEWSLLSNCTRAGLYQVIWDGKQYISVGDNGTIIKSSDGLKWVEVS